MKEYYVKTFDIHNGDTLFMYKLSHENLEKIAYILNGFRLCFRFTSSERLLGDIHFTKDDYIAFNDAALRSFGNDHEFMLFTQIPKILPKTLEEFRHDFISLELLDSERIVRANVLPSIIKNLGVTETCMDIFWEKLRKKHSSLISKAERLKLTWRDFPFWWIRELPQREELDRLKDEERKREDRERVRKYDQEVFDKKVSIIKESRQLLNKILKGKELSQKQLNYLCENCGKSLPEGIVRIEDFYFKLDSKPCWETREHTYSQPYEVVQQEVKVLKWVRKS